MGLCVNYCSLMWSQLNLLASPSIASCQMSLLLLTFLILYFK
nr:MAG TPA: hypothetical protein [Caudoviricetes sp.]